MLSLAACAQGSVNLDGVLFDMTATKSSGLLGSALALRCVDEEEGRGEEDERYDDSPAVASSAAVGLYGSDMLATTELCLSAFSEGSKRRGSERGE